MQKRDRGQCSSPRLVVWRHLAAALALAAILFTLCDPLHAQDSPASSSASSSGSTSGSPAPAPSAAAPAEPTAAPSMPTAPIASPAPAASAASPEPAQSGPPPLQSLPTIGGASLPEDLSPWGMFEAADIVVKIVMIGLALASLVTWTVWLAKSFELRSARSTVRRDLRILNESATIAQAHERLHERRRPIDAGGGAGNSAFGKPARRRPEGAHRAAARAHRNGGQPKNLARHRHPCHHRLDGALHRPVRHGVGHHE